MGKALADARATRKNILIFFVAKGNRVATKYETEYFVSPSVRPIMDKFIPVKVDFPTNTKQAYALGVFGAGTIAVTDALGAKLTSIGTIPPSPEELAKQLDAVK